jgi:hypothetical protein
MRTTLVVEQSLEMPKFIEMRNLVSAYVPNVPDFVCANAIREASRDFFRSTHSYKVTIESSLEQDLRNGFIDVLGFEYALEYVALLEAKIVDGKDLIVTNKLPRYDLSQSEPTHIQPINRSEYHVYPIPEKDLDLDLVIAVRPSFTSEGISDNAYIENEEEIRTGAIAILKSQINTEWFSPEEVPYYKQQFNTLINQKKVDEQTNTASTVVEHNIPRYL